MGVLFIQKRLVQQLFPPFRYIIRIWFVRPRHAETFAITTIACDARFVVEVAFGLQRAGWWRGKERGTVGCIYGRPVLARAVDASESFPITPLWRLY